jgi:proline dehydrogenase
MTLFRQLILSLAFRPWVQRQVMHQGILRRVASRFVAGETLEDGIATLRRLNARGLLATLDHLGEHVRQPATAMAAADAYVRALEAIQTAGVRSNVSLKLTQMGLDLSEELACSNLRRVVDRAADLDNFVRIDMESSAYTQQTLDLFYRLWAERQNVGVVLQAYLFRSAADAERLIRDHVRVRLCKGAYAEPPSLAYATRPQVDASYARIMEQLLLRGTYPALATHDERLIRRAQAFARAHAIAPDRFEFQMLHGIRRDLQDELARASHRVRVYVPYGDQWYPYLVRRLAERPANLLFFLRQLIR